MNRIVYIVDDDEMVRDSLGMLLSSVGYEVHVFPDADAFLEQTLVSAGACILLDFAMPGRNGLQVQQELVRRQNQLPIVFLTAHGDVPTAVQAVKAGASDFLQKPADGAELLARVAEAMEHSLQSQEVAAHTALIMAHYDNLTPRERDVMGLVVRGLSNKEIARHLNISFRTVEIHRSRMIHKMQAASIPELVGMASALGLHVPVAEEIGEIAPDMFEKLRN